MADERTECDGCGCSKWACEAYRTAGKVCCPDCDHQKTSDWSEVKRQARRRVARQAGILADVVVNRKTLTQSQKDEVVALLRACEKELIDAQETGQPPSRFVAVDPVDGEGTDGLCAQLRDLEALVVAQAAQLETVRQEYETLKKELLSDSSSTTSTT